MLPQLLPGSDSIITISAAPNALYQWHWHWQLELRAPELESSGWLHLQSRRVSTEKPFQLL
ncbi:hypothetical protein B0H10DRAFT_56387 [Mycena sp. CBHHK59/15]|nr:hypothetical protein B0H10DRAFT_56387 [Mycena sp. CBHHK59/15]